MAEVLSDGYELLDIRVGGSYVEQPKCFTFHDMADDSCRRCRVKLECHESFERTRPPCFGELYDPGNEECGCCLDNSQCADVIIKKGK